MADIFISYKKEDAGRVVRLVEALRAEGLSVWWDHGIAPGAQWDRTIQQELEAARLVVAVWSRESVNAPWVKEEAGVGKAKGKLAPVRIDAVDPPLGFTLIQAADLVGWSGDSNDPRWLHFLESVRAMLRGEPMASLEAPVRRRRGWALPAAALVGLGLIGAIGVGLYSIRSANVAIEGPSGSTYEANVSRTAPKPATGAPAGPDAQEQALWDKAQAEKTRAAFQSYLVSYPEGAYAGRARDALLTCRSETREVWKETPIKSNQAVRGVGDTLQNGPNEASACAAAKAMARAQAETNCRAIAANTGYRNPVWEVRDQDCSCNAASEAVTVCVADFAASCSWETLVPETVEICGG